METLTRALKAHIPCIWAGLHKVYSILQSWRRIKPLADNSISSSFLNHAAITYAARAELEVWHTEEHNYCVHLPTEQHHAVPALRLDGLRRAYIVRTRLHGTDVK